MPFGPIALRDGVSISEFLEKVDANYEERLRARDPEQVLIV